MEIDEGVPGEFGKVCHIKNQRRKRQKLLIIDLFLDFAKNTTLHGLRYITEVGLTVVEKVFWILTFIISVVLCLVLIERVWIKWCQSPVIVSFNEKMIPVGEVPFPSITVCPQWKCKRPVYNYTEELKRFKEITKEGKPIEDEKTYADAVRLEDAYLVCDGEGRVLLRNRTKSDSSVLSHINSIAPTLHDVITSCSWQGHRTIFCEKFFQKVYTREGVCFNFNALSHKDIFRKNSIQTKYKYLDADSRHGKYQNFQKNVTQNGTVLVKMEEDYPRRGQANGAQPDFIFVLRENAHNSDRSCNSLCNGFKIYLQHPTDMPQASLYYYAAMPGHVTSMALKFSVLNTSDSLLNYKPEQRQCYFPKDRELRYFNTYTPDNCRLECLSIYTYKKCKCVWFHMPPDLASNNLKLDMGDTCNCLPACDSTNYEAEILKTILDIESYRKYQEYVYNITTKGNYSFSRVEVYFKEPRFVTMRRSELFGLTDFLANCGGLLGLFLGFSFLSLVEIFYFITLRLWCTLKKDIKIEKRQLRQSVNKKTTF